MAGILLTSAIVSVSSLQPALAAPAPQQAKVTCLCDCPDDHKVKSPAAVRPVAPPPRRAARRAVRRYAGGGYYGYGMAPPVTQRQSPEAWRVAPNDAFIPGPVPMGPPVAYYPPPPAPEYGMRIDDRGWTGGVGGEGGGGGGGGGDGGYGQVHFGNGGSVENGPTYNSYNQSFQYNTSQAGPFQNRLMGGFAPATPSK